MPLSRSSSLRKQSFYYDSLYLLPTKPQPQPHIPPKIINPSDLPPPAPKLILTHDFQGGYKQHPDTRHYSFEWLASVDIFVYHTRILGTLIFEWDAYNELELLIRGPSPDCQDPSHHFINIKDPHDSISTYYANRLIDLAIDHKFHGWLINVEIDLKQLLPDRAISITHALKVWLEYFRLKGQEKIGPHWEVCWYDSISYLDGSLSWQSSLHSKHNLPFFSSSSSIFLDYHWTNNHLERTTHVVEDLRSNNSSTLQYNPPNLETLSSNWKSSFDRRFLYKHPSEHEIKQSIYFGVDVFGRGTLHGGGFSSWKATREILDQGYSVALFAPGWTWESDTLALDRAGWQECDPEWWSHWWRDERYFWSGLVEISVPVVDKDDQGTSSKLALVEPPTVYLDALRISRETVEPAHQNESGQVYPRRGITSNEFAQHIPFLELFPAKQDCPSEWFYTNWSLGSGHGFWIQGKHHFEPLDGIGDWTDMSMSFPIHDLSVGGGHIWSILDQKPHKIGLARCDLLENIGWLGSGSIEIEEQPIATSYHPLQSSKKYLWMNTTSIKCASEMKCRLVWKPIDPPNCDSSLGMVFQTSEPLANQDDRQDPRISIIEQHIVIINLSPASSSNLQASPMETIELDNGWFQSTCHLKTNSSNTKIIQRIGITVSNQSRFHHHVGEFCVFPLPTAALPLVHQSPPSLVDIKHLQVSWLPDLTANQSSIKGGKDDQLAGMVKWEIELNQNILLWLVYLQKPGSGGTQLGPPQLIAVVKDVDQIHLDISASQPAPLVEVVGVHLNFSISFVGSCSLI